MQLFTIEIENLEFEAIIGILPKERIQKQKVVVNLSFEYQYNAIEKNFIDYSEVATYIYESFDIKQFELIEEALIEIENLLYKKYPIQNLKLKITKPNILDNCQVSVSLPKS
jgi:dihydroneopterin aldolase